MYKKCLLIVLLLALCGCSSHNSQSNYLEDAMDENNAGCMFEQNGNYAKAIDCYRKSSNRGNYIAMMNLARCYYLGIGVPRNIQYALYLLQGPVSAGFAQAQFIVGYTYFAGVGVYRDVNKGLYWLRVAANNGHPGAQNLLYNIQQASNQYVLQQYYNQMASSMRTPVTYNSSYNSQSYRKKQKRHSESQGSPANRQNIKDVQDKF